ncbi:MAG: M50 family metallopeptidase [bacterium]|nr:M50 family metallopeptidase [bacterium]
MTIFLFLLILAVLVLVHEAGHFLVAKFFKIRVDEFGFGFPPRLLSFVRGETRYSLNLIPFGGFVKIFGEDPTEEIKNDETHRNFSHKPRSVQALVLVAGIVGNFLLAWLLISAGFMVGLPAPEGDQWGVPVANTALTIVEVLPDSPAASAGLRAGDILVTVGTAQAMIGENLTPEKVSAFISENAKPMTIVYTRGGKLSQVTLTPTEGIVLGKQAIGIAMDMMGVVRLPIHRALFFGAKATALLSVEVARALASFIADAFTGNADIKNLAGPVGIAGLVGQARALGAAPLLSLAALISINLALINLIPFPALDGGRLLFVAIEAVRRKAIPAKIAQTANAVGFILLLLFLVFVTYHDIARLFTS